MAIFSAINEVFGEELSPELINNSRFWSKKQISALVSKYSELQSEIQCPPKQRGQIRPFIHHNHMRTGIVPLDYTDFLKRQPGVQEDILKKHLLYCHSIVMSDPGEFILRLAKTDGARRDVLQNYLEFVSYIKDLVDEEIVILVDDWPLGMSYFNVLQGKSPKTRGNRMIQDPHNLVSFMWPPKKWFPKDRYASDADKLYTFFDNLVDMPLLESVPTKHRNTRVELSLDAIEVSLIADSLFEQNIDLYFPGNIDQIIFSKYLQFFNENIASNEGEVNALQDILSLELPGIEYLSISDIISIRKDSENFSRLRNSLGNATRRLSDIPSDILNRSCEEIRVMN